MKIKILLSALLTTIVATTYYIYKDAITKPLENEELIITLTRNGYKVYEKDSGKVIYLKNNELESYFCVKNGK